MKIKVQAYCTCGEWTGTWHEHEGGFSEVPKLHQNVIDEAKREHPQATSVNPKKGHYLRFNEETSD